MKRIALALAVAVLSSRPSAQTELPNFSGTWMQNMEKSWIQKDTPLQGYANEIAHVGDSLKVVTILLTKVRRFPTSRGNQTQTFVLEKR